MNLEVKAINKSFGEKHVLKDISFSAAKGVALGMLGRNGSGKTTTIRIIMNIFGADSGEVLINGVSNVKSKIKIGYLPEERGLYPKKKIDEQMSYIGQLRGLKHSEVKSRSLLLLEKLEATEYYTKRLDTLSKGNQQKIQLAIALLNDPDIVILDEPFSGLDPVNAILLKNLVNELVRDGKTVLFSSHQMASVEEFCDEVCMINDGTIVLSGKLRQIKNTYPKTKIMYSFDNDDHDVMAGLINKNNDLKQYIKSVEATKKGVLVTIKDQKYKTELFTKVSALGHEIESFYIVEPTLEEIFIEKAGAKNA